MMRYFLVIVFFFLSSTVLADWKKIESGVEYRREGDPAIHFIRIDPAKYRLDLLLASDYKVPALTAENYRVRSGALLVINGGFFDAAFRSLGLLHRRGQTVNPVRNAAWGIFLVDAKGPRMIQRKDWLPSRPSPSSSNGEGQSRPLHDGGAGRAVASAVPREAALNPEGVATAIQVGPRLVVDGKILAFKEAGPSRRSAIGITREGRIEIALSENFLTLKEWAEALQKDCVQALNLDGGGSSQIAVSLPGLSLKVEGFTTVPNAVAVFRK